MIPEEKSLQFNPYNDVSNKSHWLVKSITDLDRIFMIDVTSKGIFKISIEIILHFVNASRSKGSVPKIKKYAFPVSDN
jgi:hypothetical protein